MATQPDNPIVRVAQLDTTLPSTQLNNKLLPSTSVINVGYDANELVAAENLNYIFDNFGKWLVYLNDTIVDLKTQIETERVSVGEIIEISGDSRNPSILKGYGIWESFGAGRVLVGAGSHEDDRGETKEWVDGHEEGEYRHVQTEAEMAQHSHDLSATAQNAGGHNHKVVAKAGESAGTGALVGGTRDAVNDGSEDTSTQPDHTHNVTGTALNKGSSSPMNNIQPSIAVYRWKRTG